MIPLLSTVLLTASWYGPGFHGNLTANGTRYNQQASTAAHKTLPFGTKLKVCYETCETVTITDRGPFIEGRDLDLSYGTAVRIGMASAGVADAEVTRLNSSCPKEKEPTEQRRGDPLRSETIHRALDNCNHAATRGCIYRGRSRHKT